VALTFSSVCAWPQKIKSKYPDRIPVIVQKSPKSDAPEIDKKKFLVPADVRALLRLDTRSRFDSHARCALVDHRRQVR
jgi:hypothetical protein